MTDADPATVPGPAPADLLAEKLEAAAGRLEAARPFAKARWQAPVLELADRLLASDGGVDRLAALAPRLDDAGLFAGSDWNDPAALLPQLVAGTLDGPSRQMTALEAISLLRLLAVANGRSSHPGVHADGARHFLTQVLALNLRRLFGAPDEAARENPRDAAVRALFRYLADHVGVGDVLGALVEEIWRILDQRPIQTGPAKEMIAQIAITLHTRSAEVGDGRLGADRLVSALFGPTQGCLDDPGLVLWRERLAAMDDAALRREAQGLARAMHDTGLVSDYHADFLQWAVDTGRADLAPEALGLTATGYDCWRREQPLIEDLIRAGVRAETSQAVLGLSGLLERGLLHHAPIVPALRRQLALRPAPAAAERLRLSAGPAVPPETALLAGVLQVLGQPLGVGQGANPTCQSARAIAMWGVNEPDFLLHLVARAARWDTVAMHFEGVRIDSAALPAGLAAWAPIDSDAVSVVLVPHLDRVYAEMGRLCAGRGDDPHVWINPEFHGWWVGRDTSVAVHVPSGALSDIEGFLTRFHAAYHPEFNGGEPVIHPQPAGIAVTDASARFIGWHAIAILRVAQDQDGVTRVYFYNPNNDSGQDWGAGVVVSTAGKGERPGEASLPFDQFAARLYLFHADPVRPRADVAPPADRIAAIADAVRASWAAGRQEAPSLAAVEAGV